MMSSLRMLQQGISDCTVQARQDIQTPNLRVWQCCCMGLHAAVDTHRATGGGHAVDLKSPAGSMSSGHTIMAAMKMTMTAMTVGLRKRRISSISASLSTEDASRAPAFLTCARQVRRLSVGVSGSVSMTSCQTLRTRRMTCRTAGLRNACRSLSWPHSTQVTCPVRPPAWPALGESDHGCHLI